MRVSQDRLKSFITGVCVRTGTTEEDAAVLADALITTDLRGVPTHGCSRFPVYAKNLYAKKINPVPRPRLERRMPTTALVDGDNGLGPVVMVRAMEQAMEIAAEYGCAAVGVRNTNHIGACGYYGAIAATRGFVAFVTTESAPKVAPFGSAEPYFGTNPFCVALPYRNGFPIVADMSTSVASYGKIMAARDNGQPIPSGWALDRQGNPTTNAEEAAEGILLPFGAHKGSALALAAAYLSGVLTGAAFGYDLTATSNLDRTKDVDVGALICLVKYDAFLAEEQVESRIDTLYSDIKGLRPAVGFEEVLLPGERAYRQFRRNKESGWLDLDEKLIKQMDGIARLVGVEGLTTG